MKEPGGGSDDDNTNAAADEPTVTRDTAGISENRTSVSDRHGRRTDLSSYSPGNAESSSEVSHSNDVRDGESDGESSSPRVDPDFRDQVLAVIHQEQHNHLHLPGNGLDPEGLVRLRNAVPEVYEVYVDGLKQAIADESYRQRAEVDIPAKYLSRGQIYALTAVLLGFLLVAFAIYWEALWIAGIIGVLDLAALAAVFMGRDLPWSGKQQEHEHSLEEKENTKDDLKDES